MAGTLEGGRKAAETNKLKYGPDFYQIQGQKGGSVKVKKGFAKMPKEKVRAAGKLGGRNGRRTK